MKLEKLDWQEYLNSVELKGSTTFNADFELAKKFVNNYFNKNKDA